MPRVHWHEPSPANCSAWRPPPPECQGPQLLEVSSVEHCVGNSTAQRACEEHETCAGLFFDRHKTCRMLLCPDVHERDNVRDRKARDGSGGCTQRFVSKSAPPDEVAPLLDAVSDQGCSPSGFTMRHIRSQRALSFSGTPSRYFTIVEESGGTWLVWKDHVIDGNLLYARLEGADAAEPKLHWASNQTLLELRLVTSNGTFCLTHNTALLVRGNTLHLIGGRSMSPRENAIYMTNMDSSRLASAAAFGTQALWSTPTKVFDGRQPGCVDGRGNRVPIAPYVTHGVCEFDGRLSAVFFGGRFHMYTRSNPTLGRRFVQFTTAASLIGEWSPLRSIRLRGIDACAVNIYTFGAQAHPLRDDRLIAFFPAVLGCRSIPQGVPEGPDGSWAPGVICDSPDRRFELHGTPEANQTAVHNLDYLGNCSLMMACSANGQSWSKPLQLFSCRSRSGQRTASLPVSNGLRFTRGRLFVWVHQDVPTGQRNAMNKREMSRSKLVRYELDGAAFRRWSAQECGAGLEGAPEAAVEELRALPYNTSRLMKSVARLWYANGGNHDNDRDATAAKELRNTSSGWCGSRIPRAPWARTNQADHHANTTPAEDPDAVNDDFFFRSVWRDGFPYSLHRRVEPRRSGIVACKSAHVLNHARECQRRNDSHVCCRMGIP